MIRAALRTSHGRVEAAAKDLGISRKGLYLKRQRFGIDPPQPVAASA
jgi:DNA-binding NtrC family response regulator